jgi:hypothetical protein
MVTGYGNKKSATKDFVALFVGCVDYLSEWVLLTMNATAKLLIMAVAMAPASHS